MIGSRGRGRVGRPRMALALVVVVAAAAAVLTAPLAAAAATATPAADKTKPNNKNAKAAAATPTSPRPPGPLAAPLAEAAAATATPAAANKIKTNNKSAAKAAANKPTSPREPGAKAAAAAKPTTTPRAPGPLASSAILFYTKEYTEPQFGEPDTRCEQLLQSAWREGGSTSVNLVPTIYFEDDGSAPAVSLGAGSGDPAAKSGPRSSCRPDNWATVARVGRFCFKKTWDAPCVPPSKNDIAEFAAGLRRCVAKAAELGFRRVLLSPHIDDALGKGLWRNMVDFHPTQADSAGNSYWDVLLGPLVEAGAAAAKSRGGFSVWLGLQGEMGRPVFSDPAAWSAAAEKSRRTWSAAGASPDALKLGVLLPYRQVAGVNNYGPAPAGEPLSEPITPFSRMGGSVNPLPLAQWPLAPSIARAAPALATLFRRDLDFFGVSNYVKAPAPEVTPADLERGMRIAAEELRLATEGAPGVGALDLSALMRGADAARARAGKAPLIGIWSEFGIGGGRSRCGDAPARTASEAGLWPHSGSFGSYSPETDPWAGPNAFPGAKAYRMAFHKAALRLLAAGGSDAFPLDSAYLWSLTSWDPQAIHPAGRAQGGAARSGYWDVEVSGAIRAHNERAALAREAARSGGKEKASA